MLRMSGRCSINYRWLRLHLSGTEPPTIEAPVSELLARRNPDMSVLRSARAKAPVPGSDAMSSPTQRDRHILENSSRNGGRMHWQKASGYNRRSKVEASIGRYKRVIGDALKSRADDRRKAEVAIAVKALNRMRELGQAQFIRLA